MEVSNQLFNYKINQVDELCEKYPELYNTMDFYDMTREEKFETWWKRYHKVMQVKKEFFTNNSNKKHAFSWAYIFLQPSPLHLHQTMFTTCINLLGSEDQKEKWLQQANNLNIIGGYAQTELGHGSNVAGLETTATLDMKTDEFVFNTPSIRATKYWPGSLGL